MPELPEIEHLSRSLEPSLAGACVGRVQLFRPDIVRAGSGLLRGRRIDRLERHGKELALICDAGPVVVVHLGMSGQLWFCPCGERLRRQDHVHCIWRIKTASGPGRLVFRDPRRFGGLWCYKSREALDTQRWSRLGPDALGIDSRTLGERLGRTRRQIKATLLDQRVLAGIGNIYADEILFAARIHPLSRSASIPRAGLRRLARTIRQVLSNAIAAGGSTVRDYLDGQGRPGTYVMRHRVYGRRGKPCASCGRPLRSRPVSQRTTVYCPTCQRRW